LAIEASEVSTSPALSLSTQSLEEHPRDVGLGGHLGQQEPVVLELADGLANASRSLA
jgi:hypothetical protein